MTDSNYDINKFCVCLCTAEESDGTPYQYYRVLTEVAGKSGNRYDIEIEFEGAKEACWRYIREERIPISVMEIEEQHAREVAKIIWGTDEGFYLKTKGTFVEIRIRSEANIIQIQEDGTMMHMTKYDDEFYKDIPSCWQAVKFLIDCGYSIEPKL